MEKKRLYLNFASAIIIIALTMGCVSSNKEVITDTEELVKNDKIYNICLILDGTDRKVREQSTPEVDIQYLMKFVSTIRELGGVTLFLSWIDDNSENNTHVYLKMTHISPPQPPYIAPKKDYETLSEYNKSKNEKMSKYVADSVEFAKQKEEEKGKISVFQKNAEKIIDLAYSDVVAATKRGSDIHGALNLGVKLLKSTHNASESYMILISDLIHNTGRSLKEIPDDVTLIMVNESVSDHQFGERVIELANLEMLIDFFK